MVSKILVYIAGMGRNCNGQYLAFFLPIMAYWKLCNSRIRSLGSTRLGFSP